MEEGRINESLKRLLCEWQPAPQATLQDKADRNLSTGEARVEIQEGRADFRPRTGELSDTVLAQANGLRVNGEGDYFLSEPLVPCPVCGTHYLCRIQRFLPIQ